MRAEGREDRFVLFVEWPTRALSISGSDRSFSLSHNGQPVSSFFKLLTGGKPSFDFITDLASSLQMDIFLHGLLKKFVHCGTSSRSN